MGIVAHMEDGELFRLQQLFVISGVFEKTGKRKAEKLRPESNNWLFKPRPKVFKMNRKVVKNFVQKNWYDDRYRKSQSFDVKASF
jgi:hypothetical protein